MISWFDFGAPALQLWGYQISVLELAATVLYFASVLFALKPHVLTWPTGMIANIVLFILFFQVQLYSDMLLQTYFLAVSIYGWWTWRGMARRKAIPIGRLEQRTRLKVVIGMLVAVIILGSAASRVHGWLPTLFAKPAAFPYADASTTVMSVVATFLLARKRIENWVLWILVDVISVNLYLSRGIYLMAVEYAAFLGMAIIGFIRWHHLQKPEHSTAMSHRNA